jgi:phage tail sheath gpL-like
MAGLPSINLRALLVGTMLAGTTVSITGVTWSAGVATYTTSAAHGVPVGGTVTIAGVNPAGYNGTFTAGTGTTGSTIMVPIATSPGTYVSGGTAYHSATAGGKATPNIPVPIGSQAQSIEAFGAGSELDRMFRAFYANNFANEVWGLPLAPSSGSSVATGTITVITPPTDAGTLHLYISGVHVPVNILTTDTVTDIASEIVAAIMADDTLPVTATNTAGVVTLTSIFTGVNANEITVGINYYGPLGSEITPPGLALTLPATGMLTGGVGTPDMTTAIANLGEEPFEYIAMPYTDSNSLFLWDQEFGFTDQGRWGWQRELFGHVFSAKRGSYSNLLAFGETQNSGVESILGVEQQSPSPTFEWTAAYTAKAQRALINDPARPLQSLSLNQIKLAPLQDRFDFVELNSLASTGIAIQKAGSDRQPMIAREQTTYQLNLYGQTDDAYELVTTLATLAKLLRNQKAAVTDQFPRHKLADDGTKFGPGQAIVTPGIVKAFLIAQYRQDMYDGLVENLQQFKAHLLVERDSDNPNRLNVLYPPDLINQLRIFAVLAQFRLQYDRGVDQTIIGNAPPPFNAVGGTPQ